MSESTIAAGIVRALMEFAVSKRASSKALAERSGIAPAQLRDPDSRIPFANYVALMRAAKVLCKDPALALHFGEAFNCAEMSIVGLIGGACETLAESFAQINRYARLAADIDVDGGGRGERLQLKRNDGQVWLVDTRKNPDDFPELTESTFSRMVCTSRRFVGEKPFVKAVHVTHTEPGYRAEYDRIFRVPLVFESDRNALLLADDAWLNVRNVSSSRYASDLLTAHADELLRSLDSSKTTRGRVESLLTPILHTGEASIDTIAAKLGISRQTLFRRLKAEGVTFEKVLDELRHKLSLYYLSGRSGKKRSVNETAYLVGFSDPAAFSRAFKRWTRSSPRMMLFGKGQQ